ncbi:MAG: hypothetical protein KC503_05005 [Myxococcales bacterium]|nr:hypothetical protein [Myxococcales bacterium]
MSGRARGAAAVGLIAASFLAAAAATADARNRTHGRAIEVQGHRGARARRAENTLSAFRYAISVGVDTLELDVAVTRDDKLVVTHDLVLSRTLCRRRAGKRLVKLARDVAVRSLTRAELDRYTCSAVPNPRFPAQKLRPGGEPIASLEQVLELARRARRPLRLNIETKCVPDRRDLSPPPARFVKLVAGALAKAGLTARATLQSFDHRVLAVARRVAPELARVVLVAESRPDYVAVARAVGARVVSPNQHWIDARDVKAMHAAGLRVVPWTVNGARAWRRVIALGVDGIISDDPAGLLRYLRRHGQRR